MKKIGLAALSLTAALALAGCSGSAPAPAIAGGGSTAAGQTSAPPAQTAPKKDVPAAGSEVPKEEFADRILKGADGIKTMESVTESETSYGGQTSKAKVTMTVDRTDPNRVKSHMVSEANSGSEEMYFDGPIYYTKSKDGGWQKRDSSKESQSGGIQLAPVNTGDLDKIYESYKKAITKVVYVGEEKVDGVDASHYTVDMDMGAMLGGAGSPMTTEMYLDAQDRAVRTDLNTADSKSVTKQGKFNQPVTITFPADAKEA